jgi:hypothetical protein
MGGGPLPLRHGLQGSTLGRIRCAAGSSGRSSSAQAIDPLIAAGCPAALEETGLDRARLKGSYAQAQQIVSRCTFFDLAAAAGGLPECVETLFAPASLWFEA